MGNYAAKKPGIGTIFGAALLNALGQGATGFGTGMQKEREYALKALGDQPTSLRAIRATYGQDALDKMTPDESWNKQVEYQTGLPYGTRKTNTPPPDTRTSEQKNSERIAELENRKRNASEEIELTNLKRMTTKGGSRLSAPAGTEGRPVAK